MVEGSYCTMFGTGLIVSWVYLRFYQVELSRKLHVLTFQKQLNFMFSQVHSNGSKGDTAESFSFATLFPNVLQPGVSVISNTIFSIFVKCKICKKPVRRYDVGAPTGDLTTDRFSIGREFPLLEL